MFRIVMPVPTSDLNYCLLLDFSLRGRVGKIPTGLYSRLHLSFWAESQYAPHTAHYASR